MFAKQILAIVADGGCAAPSAVRVAVKGTILDRRDQMTSLVAASVAPPGAVPGATQATASVAVELAAPRRACRPPGPPSGARHIVVTEELTRTGVDRSWL